MSTKGRVSRFGHKGFGFIVADNGKEYFLHQNDIEKSIRLKQNDEVSFTPDENERGLIARKVKLIKSSQSVKRNTSSNRTTVGKKQTDQLQSVINPKFIGLLLIISVGLNLYLIFGS